MDLLFIVNMSVKSPKELQERQVLWYSPLVNSSVKSTLLKSTNTHKGGGVPGTC